MITPELQTYIRQQLGAGIAKDVIKQNLSAKGWNVQDLDDAFFVIENSQPQPSVAPPPVVQAPVQTPVQTPVQSPVQNLIQPAAATPNSHKGIWAIVIVVLLLVCAGGAFAAYYYGLFTIFTKTELPSAPISTASSTIPFNTGSSTDVSTLATTTAITATTTPIASTTPKTATTSVL